MKMWIVLLSFFVPFSSSGEEDCVRFKSEHLAAKAEYDKASVELDHYEAERYKIGRYLNQADSKLGVTNSQDWLKKAMVDSSTARALNNARQRARRLGVAADLNKAYLNGAEPTEQDKTEAVAKFEQIFSRWKQAVENWKRVDSQLIQANRLWASRKAGCS